MLTCEEQEEKFVWCQYHKVFVLFLGLYFLVPGHVCYIQYSISVYTHESELPLT